MNAFTALLPYFFTYGYIALFVILFLSAAYFPFPANIALIGAGVLSRFGINGVHFNVFIATAVALAGNVLGDLTGYFIARQFGTPERRRKYEQKHHTFVKMEKYMKEHPYLTIGITRNIGFVSPVVNSLAGFTKFPLSTFFWSDIVGNAFYTSFYIGAGYLIGSVSNDTDLLIQIIAGVVVVVGIFYGIALYFINQK